MEETKKTNILTELIDKIKQTIGPATKEIGAYADPISPETSVSFYAVKDGYKIVRDNRLRKSMENILIRQEVLSLTSFFAMLKEHKTAQSYIFFNDDVIHAKLNYALAHSRGKKNYQEYIFLKNNRTEIFEALMCNLDRGLTGKQVYTLAAKLAASSSLEVDINALVAFNKLKISQETSILDEDFNKGYELTVKAAGKNAVGELVKLPNSLQFKLPPFKGFSSEAFINLRISMEMGNTAPLFTLSWDSKEKDMEEYRRQIRDEIIFVAKPYGCEDVPLIEGIPHYISDNDDEFWFENPED